MTEEKPDYDKLACPHINAFDACKPEVWEFTAPGERGTKYRAVLLGKKGHFGYVEEAVIRVEWQDGEDALGVPTWRNAGSEIELAVVAQLLVAVRGVKAAR